MSRPRLPLPKGVPKTLRYHGLDFEVWALADDRLAFDYAIGAERGVCKRRSLEKLRADAERIALSIVNAETAARDLTADDRRIAIAAFGALAPTGLHLDAVARDVAEAHKLTGGKISIADLARFWSRRSAECECPPAAQVLDELIAHFIEHGRSSIYWLRTKRDLVPFVSTFPDLTLVTPRDLTAYLRDLKKGTRRRDNIRDAIVRLYTFARDAEYLPKDTQTAAEKIDRIDEGISHVTTYTPAQIRVLLANIGAEWRPWFLLAAFAGLRTSEVFRLEWNAIIREQGIIGIGRRVARKVKISRKPPIQLNLAEFLDEYREFSGPIYPNIESHGCGRSWQNLEAAHTRAIAALSKASGVKWERNALRHSYGSHRLAIVKNEAHLSLEMGNSISQVREYYNDPKTEKEALEYFDVRPQNHANVLYLDLKFGTTA